MAVEADGPVAVRWLGQNPNLAALASNRFQSTQAALRFVERLYAAGAQRVIIPAAAIQEDETGPYADALVVFLPPEGPARERVIWMCAVEMGRELGEQELDPEEYVGTKAVYLWWD